MKSIGKKAWKLLEYIINFFLKLLFNFFNKEFTEEISNGFMQFVKFGIVGLSNTVISYVIYAGLLILFKQAGILMNSGYLVSQTIAFIISVAWSFYWNNKMVFVVHEGQERSIWRALIKTYISYSFTGLFLSTVLLVLWVQVCHISEFIAPAINLLVTIPLNFLINKFWAFKER